MSAHMTPEQVRSKIDHPIVDGDGHWVEYDPVFSDKMRKVGGDMAADGFLSAMGRTREALSLSVAERQHKRLGQQAFWARQCQSALKFNPLSASNRDPSLALGQACPGSE